MRNEGSNRPVVVRRRGDVVALVASIGVIALSTGVLGPVREVPDAERSVFRALNGLPDGLRPFVVPGMQLGAALAIAIVAVVCVLVRRRRLAAVVAAAGYGAYLIARLSKLLVGRERPGELLDAIQLRDQVTGLGFPSGHSAVSMAIVLAVLPYLVTRWRWALLVVPAFVGFARVYVGAHLPLDVVSGWAIGVAAALITHLAFGVPRRMRGSRGAEDGGERGRVAERDREPAV